MFDCLQLLVQTYSFINIRLIFLNSRVAVILLFVCKVKYLLVILKFHYKRRCLLSSEIPKDFRFHKILKCKKRQKNLPLKSFFEFITPQTSWLFPSMTLQKLLKVNSLMRSHLTIVCNSITTFLSFALNLSEIDSV